MKCEELSTCIFFNDRMESMPAVADLLKTQYCQNEFAECARLKVAARVGGSHVPADLYPSDHSRAAWFLADDRT